MAIKIGLLQELRLYQHNAQGDLEDSLVLFFRPPTTSERNEYMAQIMKHSKCLKDLRTQRNEPMTDEQVAAVAAMDQLRTEYGMKILSKVEGAEFPEGQDWREVFAEHGGNWLTMLCAHAYEGVKASKVGMEEDLGKSSPRSNGSAEDEPALFDENHESASPSADG